MEERDFISGKVSKKQHRKTGELRGEFDAHLDAPSRDFKPRMAQGAF
jgi:hypothetical protein